MRTRRSKSPTLYPFLLSGRLTHENEGVKWYVISTILMAVGIVVLWVHWLNATMGGGSHRPSAGLPPTAPLVMVQQPIQPATVRATPYRMWGGSATAAATPVVTPTLAGSPVAMRVTPAPAAVVPTPLPPPTATTTPAPRQVQVMVRAYWPDDSPNWCLTWDEDGERCLSPLFSGDDWHALIGQAWACDIRWYGDELDVPGIGRGRCLDVGETFTCTGDESLCTVGLLSPLPVGEDDVIYLGYLHGDGDRWQPVG